MKSISRSITNHVIEALQAFPVVYIAGPRQSGKTTLVQHIAATEHKAQYLTFDDLQIRSAAQRDPEAFLRSIEGPVVLDEIQMVPELFRPLKMIVDENRGVKGGGRGKFLLTGSASVMALPKLSDALVGRMSLHTLLPLSAQELQGDSAYNFIDRVFTQQWKFGQLPKGNTIKMMLEASFPELLSLKNQTLCYEWCNGYINTILQRDVRVLMEVEKLNTLPDVLHFLATRTGGLLNDAVLSRGINLNHITTKRYRALLESLFLTFTVPAWSNNLGKRLIKAPKVYINDLNLLAYLLNVNLLELPQKNQMLFGQVLENFVGIELSKQLTFSNIRAKLYHYRSTSGQEIDFVLEGPGSRVVGIEVKARSKVNAKDFHHLEAFSEELGEKFHCGLVLYQGVDIVPFGKKLWAVPLSALWH
jgi:hypothetical protein